MMRTLLLLLLLRRGSGGEFQDRLAAALDASLHKYPAVANRTEDAARYLARVLWMRKFSVLVYEGTAIRGDDQVELIADATGYRQMRR